MSFRELPTQFLCLTSLGSLSQVAKDQLVGLSICFESPKKRVKLTLVPLS